MDEIQFLEIILNYLKQKGILSDLEKDMLSTIDKYIERPFDRKGAEHKIVENNSRYPDIFLSISALPGIENKPFDKLTDQEVQHDLFLQIQAMWAKEQEMDIWEMQFHL